MLEGRITDDNAPEDVAEFETYLRNTRGLGEETCRWYVGTVRAFLRWKRGNGPVDVSELTAADIVAHVVERASELKPGTVKQIATALKSFARCLRLRGLWKGPMVDGIPMVPYRKLAQVPKLLSDQQVKALLGVFDRDDPAGLRGYAIALCLLRLGLRAGEAARLGLDDVDWRRGTLRIAAGKGRRARLLPLPVDVGRAIVAYLRRGRPRISARCLFVRRRAPLGAMSSRAVRHQIRRGWTRTGVEIPSKGTHALRHTAATGLLRGGASLKEIADLLGHRTLDTTAIYAKVDLESLAQVARPWPEVRM